MIKIDFGRYFWTFLYSQCSNWLILKRKKQLRHRKAGWLRIRKVHSFLHQTFHLSLPLATAELETFPTLA